MHTADLHGNVTSREQDGHLVVRVDGVITALTAEETRSGILSAWDNHAAPTALILDLGGVPQMDSSGIGLLMELANRTAKANVPFALCALQEKPARLLNKIHLDGRFQTYPTVEDALLATSSPAGGGYRSGSTANPAPDTTRIILPAARRRSRPEESVRPRRSHRFFWALTVLVLTVLIAAGVYGYLAVAAYRGNMTLLPAMQSHLVQAGRRIDAIQNAFQGKVVEQDNWRKQAQTRMDDTSRALNQETQQSAAGRDQLQAELDRNTANLQSQLDTVKSAQEEAGNRIDTLEQQVRQLQTGSSGEGRLDESTGTPNPDHKSLNLPVSTPREIAPGVWIDIGKTDVARHQFDGRVWLAPGHQAVAIHGGLNQPISLPHAAGHQTVQLVVTSVGEKSVAGYVAPPSSR